MDAYIQIMMGLLGTVGFSLLFHVRGKKIIAIAVGGALSWAIYLAVLALTDDKAIGLLISTASMGILAEIFARVFKAPAIIFLVPMLIPLIPGGDLYYTTSFLLRGDYPAFTAQLKLLLIQAGAIAFGIILVACLIHIPRRGLKKAKEKE